MAYYVGTKEFPSIYAAVRYLAENPQEGVEITSEPVESKPAPATKEGMLTGTESSDEYSEVELPPPSAPEEAEAPPPTPPPPPPPSEPEGVTTFTFFEGAERGDANPNALYARGDATQVTEAELREYFNAQGSGMLKRAFGDFDNYLAYMTEREQLIQSGDYDVGNWDEATGGLTEDQLMILEGEDLTQYSDTDQDAYTEAYGQRMQEQSAAYDNWVNSEANQALLAKYGVGSTIYNNDGDKYEWNGSAYVKTVKQDQAGLVDYVKMGIVTAIGVMTGGAIAPALSGGAAAGTAASVGGQIGASVLSNAITQAITTGSIDPDQLLQTAATAGFSQALNQFIGPELKEALNGLDISEITGIEELDNVLNTMGQTAIRQAVFDGELDIEGVLASGLITGAQEFVEFLFVDLPGQQGISEEKQQKLEELYGEYAAAVDEETMAETNRIMGNTVNEAIATQQNEAMRNQLQALAGNLQSIYEEAYAPTTTPYDEALADFTESTVDAAGSEFADTTDELTVDTTADAEPMQSVMYVDDQAVPADRVAEILEGSTVVTTLDGSGDYEYGPMELGDTYLAYHTQHVDESGIEYTLIRGSNGRLYVSDGTNLVEYQGASDLTHNNAQISWLDSHLVSGGGLPTDANNARFLDVTLDVDGAGAESASQRIFENMEAGWQDVNNPTLESSMAQETPDTPLEVEVEVDPFEYEEEPELTPEPPPEPEPVEQEQPQQGQGEEGAPTPAPAPAPVPPPPPPPPVVPPPPPPPPPPPEPPPEAPPEAPPADPIQEAIDAATQTDVGTGQETEVPAGEQATGQESETPITDALFPEYATEPPPAQPTETVPSTEPPKDEGIGVPTPVETQPPTPVEQPSGVTTEDVTNIVNEAVSNIPPGMTSDDVKTIVNNAIGNIEFPEGMTEEQVSEIVSGAIGNIEFPQSLTVSDVNDIVSSAIANIKFPEATTSAEVAEIVQNILSETPFATPEEVASAVAQAGYATPADIGTALSQAGFATPQDIANALTNAGFTTPEDVATALSNAGYVTPEQLGSALASAGFATPEDIASAVTNAGFATPEDIDTALSSAGFATAEDVLAGQTTAEKERQDLQEAIIAVGGDITKLDEATQKQFEEFGESIDELFEGVGVDIKALQEGQISQAEAFAQYQEDALAQAEEAAEERADLQEAIIAVGGDITALDESTKKQFEEFGGTVDDLFSDVNVDIKALQEGQISQAEAQQAFEQSVASQFGDVTGQLGEIGGQVGGLMSEVSGIGQGLEGLGQGIAGLGEGLGAGLMGLAAQQAMLPGQIAAATPIQPQKFEKFQRGLTRRKLADPLRIGMFTGGARSV